MMSGTSDLTSKALEIRLDEYDRLRKRYEALVDGSFEDFRMLAALGAFLAWPPLAGSASGNGTVDAKILFIGFCGILAIVVVLAIRDVLKWSMIDFHLKAMLECEAKIDAALGNEAPAIAFARRWPQHRTEHYLPIYNRFALAFVLLLLLFPVVLLLWIGALALAGAYSVVFAVLFSIYISAAKKLGWDA